MRKKQVPFSVIIPTIQNVDEIQGLLYPHYFNESGYSHLDYCHETTKKVIIDWITNGACFLIKSKNTPVAFAAMCLMKTFYKQLEADVDMFFVMPEYRGTGIARVLSECISDYANSVGASVVYTSCLSGLGKQNNSQYINLWKKLGFKELGTVMIRS